MRKLKLAFGFLLLMLPEWLVGLVQTGRREVVDGRRIDPKAKAVSDLVAMIRDPSAPVAVSESRRQLAETARRLDEPCPDTVDKRDLSLPGAAGDLPTRLYVPEGADPASGPALLYLHGGGWIQGDLETHDGLCGKLASLSGVRVISLDYRLAPEDPFPAAPEDVLAAYRALINGAGGLGVTSETLAVGGDSAGGNLTACLMHDLGRLGLPKPCAQLLIYPAVDGRLQSHSIQSLADQALLPRPRIDWYLDLYIPEGTDRLIPRISPLLSEHLAEQPEALIVAGGHDPLWDDAFAYAAALEREGVRVQVLDYPGQIHAFLSLRKVIPQGNDALARCAVWLKDVMATNAKRDADAA